jgi:alpha-L-fucosidase
MKRLLFLTAAILTLIVTAYGQNYQPNWESLDKRPVPGWYQDAKFGIFIHWGVYSVPAWAPFGDSISVYDRYAEWYWNKLVNSGSKVNKYFRDFHLKTYGPNFRYQDFAPMFKAELFNPDQWADLFRRAGARYIVLTSKHHEGFALWPSAQSWNWNSADVGPHRDLCGDLTKAVKKTGLHMGFYYSLYEWFNPVYQSNLENYVDNHMIPQMKDLVVRYEPDLVWTDGEWDHTSAEWKSEQYLEWLFNQSPVRETVVVNDRWGSETRSRHGGFYTTEYGLVGDKEGLEDANIKPWEECRGIGTSFGFNRTENAEDYTSSADLVKLLISTVAAGGNLLLDIGPAGDGTISPIMQQRLLDIGRWLDVNGEAIYGTRAFRKPGDLKSINPELSKTIFLTRKNKDLYVICLKWPDNEIVLNGIGSVGNPLASMLGTGKEVGFRKSGSRILIKPPVLGPGDFQLAYVFRLKNILK